MTTPTIDTALLIKLYHAQPLSVDKLPYTVEMEELVVAYNRQKAHDASPLELYRMLMHLRKNGKLIARSRKPALPSRTGLFE